MPASAVSAVLLYLHIKNFSFEKLLKSSACNATCTYRKRNVLQNWALSERFLLVLYPIIGEYPATRKFSMASCLGDSTNMNLLAILILASVGY